MLRAIITTGILLLSAAFLCAQDEPKPQVPEDAFSARELIAWSSLQKPQPTPQPLPPADKPIPEPSQGREQSTPPNTGAESQQSPADAFVGRISKSGESFILTVSGGTTYELASENDLAKFENKTVRVRGQLEPNGKRIRVTKVEVLS